MYNKKIQIAGFYFVLPTLIIYGIFLIYPMITAFHYSFFKWNLLSEKKYVALSNFAKMINDKRFWNSYITTFHFTLISIVIIIILSFIGKIYFNDGLDLALNSILRMSWFLMFLIFFDFRVAVATSTPPKEAL